MSWLEVDGAGWSWVEVDGAWWRWVHGLVILDCPMTRTLSLKTRVITVLTYTFTEMKYLAHKL